MRWRNSGGNVIRTSSYNVAILKPGLAFLMKAELSGYGDLLPWTGAAPYVRYVQNQFTAPRPVITFPAVNTAVKRADLKLDWTMSVSDLGSTGTVRPCSAMH